MVTACICIYIEEVGMHFETGGIFILGWIAGLLLSRYCSLVSTVLCSLFGFL